MTDEATGAVKWCTHPWRGSGDRKVTSSPSVIISRASPKTRNIGDEAELATGGVAEGDAPAKAQESPNGSGAGDERGDVGGEDGGDGGKLGGGKPLGTCGANESPSDASVWASCSDISLSESLTLPTLGLTS